MSLWLGELGVSLLSILMGLVFGLFSLRFPGPASEGDLGPAFFPQALSVILIVLGIIQGFCTCLHKRSSVGISREVLIKVLFGMLICAVYVFLIPVCGYFYATAALGPALLFYQGYRRLSWIVILTIASLAMAYLIFYRFLAVPLPL